MFLLDGVNLVFFFLVKNIILKKKFEFATYFCFIFKGKQNKKENSKCNSKYFLNGYRMSMVLERG